MRAWDVPITEAKEAGSIRGDAVAQGVEVDDQVSRGSAERCASLRIHGCPG